MGYRPISFAIATAVIISSLFALPVPSHAAQTIGKILFTSDRNAGYGVYVINADGTNIHRLVQDSIVNGTTSWSADGTIAFVSGQDGRPQIYTMNSDGSNEHRVSNGKTSDISPTWMPDGKHILCDSISESLRILNVDGGDPSLVNGGGSNPKLSPDGTLFAYQTFKGLSVAGIDGKNPKVVAAGSVYRFAWSPDGKSLVFSSIGQSGAEIDVVGVKGNGKHTLTKHGGYSDLAWSPDGKYIAYTDNGDKGFGIYLMTADGATAQFVTAGDAIGFSFSPDGKQIAFNSGRDRHIMLYAMDVDGSNATQMTDMSLAPQDSNHPSFSPDGSRIVFTEAKGNSTSVVVVGADGTNSKEIANGYSPHWSPDGKRIAFSSYVNQKQNIFIADADGSNEQLITDKTGNFSAWSPDGTQILFTVPGFPDPKTTGIYKIGIDGKNEVRLSRDPVDVPDATVWSRDGKFVAYCNSNGGKLMVMTSDGKNLKSIAPSNQCVRSLWSPDGTQIAVFDFGKRTTKSGQKATTVYSWGLDLIGIGSKDNHEVANFNSSLMDTRFLIVWSLDGKQLFYTSDTNGNAEVYSINLDGSNLHNLSNNAADDEVEDIWLSK